MADARSVAEASPLRFDRVVVIGGGCYGSWYAGQLERASARGRLVANDVIVVDRDPRCRVVGEQSAGRFPTLRLRVERAEWGDFLGAWFAEGRDAVRRDAMVPSPLMPHLCLEWLQARAMQRWPGRRVGVRPLSAPPPMPWERAAPDGRHYVSFATWTCPVNCIEPAKCPATRGPRDWSMPPALARYAEAPGSQVDGAVIFHCTHRTYGVGMIDAVDIVDADRRIAEWGDQRHAAVLVGTVSHCHGALGVLEID